MPTPFTPGCWDSVSARLSLAALAVARSLVTDTASPYQRGADLRQHRRHRRAHRVTVREGAEMQCHGVWLAVVRYDQGAAVAPEREQAVAPGDLDHAIEDDR